MIDNLAMARPTIWPALDWNSARRFAGSRSIASNRRNSGRSADGLDPKQLTQSGPHLVMDSGLVRRIGRAWSVAHQTRWFRSRGAERSRVASESRRAAVVNRSPLPSRRCRHPGRARSGNLLRTGWRSSAQFTFPEHRVADLPTSRGPNITAKPPKAANQAKAAA